MANQSIADYIDGQKIILDETNFTYGNQRIKVADIIDFDFSHGYTNAIGGMDLVLRTKEKKIKVGVLITGGRSFNNRANELEALRNLSQSIIPRILPTYVKSIVGKIESGEKVKIWKVWFTQRGVFMRPRTQLWLNTIDLPYKDADVSLEERRVGLLGASGRVNVFYLIDKATRENHKYSRSPDRQPSQGQYLKIQSVLNTLKQRW